MSRIIKYLLVGGFILILGYILLSVLLYWMEAPFLARFLVGLLWGYVFTMAALMRYLKNE